MRKLLNSFISTVNFLHLKIDLVSYCILFSYSEEYLRPIEKFGPFIFCEHLLFFLKSCHLLPCSQRWVLSSLPSWNWHHEFYSRSKEACGDGIRLVKNHKVALS